MLPEYGLLIFTIFVFAVLILPMILLWDLARREMKQKEKKKDA